MNWKNFRVASAVFVTGFFIWSFQNHYELKLIDKTVKAGTNNQTNDALFSAAIDFSSKNYYENLPVKDVTLHKAANEWASVIYLPQYHKYPGSQTNDPNNDHAVEVQKDTYQILKQLIKDTASDFVMVEGELKGKIGDEKKLEIADKIQIVSDLADNLPYIIEQLKQNTSPILQTTISNTGDQLLSSVERDVILTGAPKVLWAENDGLELYGTENADTLQTSTDLVRDNFYLQDRLATLNTTGSINITGQTTTGSTANINNLLQLFNASQAPEQVLLQSLSAITQTDIVKNNIQLGNGVNKILTACNSLIKDQQDEQEKTKNSPSRENNPYNTISDKNKINELIKKNEDQINQTVVEKRNQETAQNLADTLKEKNEKMGILQFGAGHSEGLIKAINALGITVIEVTPASV